MKSDQLRTPKHLLGLEYITSDDFFKIINNSLALAEISSRDIKKTPALRGKTIINFFCEPSTRTRTSFEIAGKWLSADTINVTAADSSFKKGESFVDTIKTLQAMHPDAIVVRHQDGGIPNLMAKHLKNVAILNAGDGTHEHPTQALLDCVSLIQHYGLGVDGLRNKTIAIVGDVLHSRVVRSNLWAHYLLGNKVKLVGPSTLVPKEFEQITPGNVSVHHDLKSGVEGADIVMCLRLQLERQNNFFIPNAQEYTNQYFVSRKLLNQYANSNYVVMHPGPINRGIEVETDLIDSNSSLVESQISAGLAVRMACLIRSCIGEETIAS